MQDLDTLLRTVFGAAGATVVGGGGLWLWLNYVKDIRKTYAEMLTDVNQRMDEQEARYVKALDDHDRRCAAEVAGLRDELKELRSANQAMLTRMAEREWRDRQAPGAT